MRGKKRTKKQKNELFRVLELYLELGYSLKKACKLTKTPYSTIRDILDEDEALRAKTYMLQNKVNTKARQNIINSIEKGNVSDAKWWLERMDDFEIDEKEDEQKEPFTNEVVFVDFSEPEPELVASGGQ